MEKQATNTPVTDDQELANVLAGMNSQTATSATDDNKPADEPAAADLQYEETGDKAPASDQAPADEPAADEVAAVPTLDELEKTVAADTAETAEVDSPAPAPAGQPTTPSLSPELDSLKKDAVAELRPLVDKLDLPADEKFDTLLLIIRSTDDQSLLAGAHEAAKAIDDDAKRAQALLDIIKEIDYFANQPKS